MRIRSGKTGVKSKVRSVHPHQEFQGVPPRPRDHGPEAEVGTESICNFCGGLKTLDINTGRSIRVILTKVWKISDNLLLACVASVSNRVTARKLEREQKKKRWKGEGEWRRGNLHSFIPLPLPRHSFFFCSRPNFLDELARTRLLRRLTICKSIFLSPLSLISWLVLGYGRWELVHFLARDFSNKLQRDVLWKLSTFSTCCNCWTDTEWRINVQNLAVKQLACSSWFHLSLEHFVVI